MRFEVTVTPEAATAIKDMVAKGELADLGITIVDGESTPAPYSRSTSSLVRRLLPRLASSFKPLLRDPVLLFCIAALLLIVGMIIFNSASNFNYKKTINSISNPPEIPPDPKK